MSDPLETVSAFFAEDDRSVLGGQLAEVARWDAAVPDHRGVELERERTLESLELLEQTEDRAVIEVHASTRWSVRRGTWRARQSFDGPAVLERTADGWRIVDYTVDGRRRSQSLIVGPLAEQEQGGIAVRVLAVERAANATYAWLEIRNDGPVRVRPQRALILLAGVWRRVGIQADDIEPGGTGIVGLSSHSTVDLTAHVLTIGLLLRSGQRRSRFLLHAPLARPDAPFRHPPPRRLPLVQSDRAVLAIYAVMTAAFAWWLGWFALIVPIFLVLAYWRNIRAIGRIPERAYPFRRLLDVLVAGGCVVLAWETPAAELAIPIVVALAVYGLLGLARASEATRIFLTISAATAWLTLLGGPGDTFSPCRIGDGRPSAVADQFAHDVLAGDVSAAHRLQTHRDARFDPLLPHGVARPAVEPSVATRRDVSSNRICDAFSYRSVTSCYTYRVGAGANGTQLLVGIGCEARHWRVELAL